LGFALLAAGRLRAVTLMTQVALIGTIKLFAAKAFAPDGTLHWAHSKNVSGPSCKTPPQAPSKWWNKPTKSKKSEQNEEKFCMKSRNKKSPAGIRFLNRWVHPIFRSAVTIKSRPQQEFVVCGFTEGKGSRKFFGALLLAAYRNGKLRYFGHSGTGFSEKGLRETIERLKPLFTDKPAVENPPKIPEKIQWVQPKLVCEVAFAEWTEDEQLRQTTFLGWRDDKNAKDVRLELK
jgi:hypothetical protein